MIYQFREENYFLSNFAMSSIIVNPENMVTKRLLENLGCYKLFSETLPNYIFPSGEHLFQALKCTKVEDMLAIKAANSPGEAKRIGRRVAMRNDWHNPIKPGEEEVRVNAMYITELLKYVSSDALNKALLNTKGETLIEGNTHGDVYWGVSLPNFNGKNKLGTILMDLRAFRANNTNKWAGVNNKLYYGSILS